MARPVPAKKSAQPVYQGVLITHAERVIDPLSGQTKGDVARYYEGVAPFLLPHLKARPVSLVRAPRGIAAALFFQKHMEAVHIAGVVQQDAALEPAHPALLGIVSPEGVLGSVQMNTIEFHTWNARVDAIEKPDRLVFDLDPGEGVAFAAIIEGAEIIVAFLESIGLSPFVKTSGGKGLHIVVPIARRYSWARARDFSEALVERLADEHASRFVVKSGPKNRVGKIFVDYLRNTRSATTAAAFSARARPGLGVSMPVAREELASLESGSQWTTATALAYLKKRQRDPWADYLASAARLESAAKKIGFRLS